MRNVFSFAFLSVFCFFRSCCVCGCGWRWVMRAAVRVCAVRTGGVTSLIGPNGAGKTTAFNIITGFQTPSAGRVAYAGRAITGWRPCRIAALGLVRTFQKTSVFPTLSVLDNVLTGLHLRGAIGIGAALLR